MKRLPILLVLAALVVSSTLMGCRDENDPAYWLDQMHDRPWREKSLKTLNEIFNKRMQENNNDLQHPKVKELVDLMVPKLVEGYKAFDRDKFNRLEILKLLAQMKDERAVEVFLQGLTLGDTADAMTFQVSANAVRRQKVEAALPKLLEAHEKAQESRKKRGGAPFTNSENEIEQAFISAASAIIAANPDNPQKGKVVEALKTLAETPDTLQELRLNMKALKGLGKIGDRSAIPTLIKGIAMKGKRQPIGLGTIAFAALQQIHDRDAVVDAIIAFGKKEDKSFLMYYQEEIESDPLLQNPNWYKQQAVDFLGELAYPSEKALSFLNEEFNHQQPDKDDERAAQLQLKVNFEPEGWAVMRRNWAAVSLAQLGHKPLLETVKTRLDTSKKGLQIRPEEAVGYVRALGLLQYPKESCGVLKEVAKVADDSLRDKTFYNASLMCGEEFLPVMEKELKKINCDKIIEERFPDGASEEEENQARNECGIMKKRIQGYMDRIAFGLKCKDDFDCYAQTVAKHNDPNVERAIYAVYRMGRDNPAMRDKTVAVLTENLGNTSKVALQASIFALDQMTPKGSDALIAEIQRVYNNFARQSTYKDRARMLEAFIGHVRNRGRS